MDRDWSNPDVVRDALQASGRTQKDLAAALGVAPSAISRLFSHRRHLKAAELARIDKFFETTAATLLPNEFRRYEDGSWRPLQHQIANRLQTAVAGANIDNSLLAQAAHLPLERLTAIMQGRGDFPDVSVWASIAEAIGVDRDWLMFGGLGLMRPTPLNFLKDVLEIEGDDLSGSETRPGAAVRPGGLIPVYSHYESSYSPLKITPWRLAQLSTPPAPLVGVSDAFGIYVSDDFMSERYLRGDIVFCHPWRPPRPGAAAMAVLEGRNELLFGRVVEVTTSEVLLGRWDYPSNRGEKKDRWRFELASLRFCGTVVSTETTW